MLANLLAAIEADINNIVTQNTMNELSAEQFEQSQIKKQQLTEIAMQYIELQKRYREVSGANSIY